MLEQLVGKLKEKGCRITPQRRTIIEAIIQSHGILSAYDVWALVKDKYEDIGLDTIYRNLKLLTDLGILLPVSGQGKESMRYELSGIHHHHLVCLKCGQAVCLDICPVDVQFISALRKQGHELVRHNLEFFGICKQCNLV